MKLIDFGFGQEVDSLNDTKLSYFCGTPSYMSPEMTFKKEYMGGPNDVWALGVILYILLTGKQPFFAEFEHDLFRKIRQGKYRWPNYLLDDR